MPKNGEQELLRWSSAIYNKICKLIKSLIKHDWNYAYIFNFQYTIYIRHINKHYVK